MWWSGKSRGGSFAKSRGVEDAEEERGESKYWKCGKRNVDRGAGGSGNICTCYAQEGFLEFHLVVFQPVAFQPSLEIIQVLCKFYAT